MPIQDNPGYHLASIPRGRLGEVSKIAEEALEALDAQAQGAQVMVLVELSDLAGAMEAYCARHAPAGLPSCPFSQPASASIDDIAAHVTALAHLALRLPGSHPTVLEGVSGVRVLIQAYLAAHHPSICWQDLTTMAAITARAFRSGRRA